MALIGGREPGLNSHGVLRRTEAILAPTRNPDQLKKR